MRGGAYFYIDYISMIWKQRWLHSQVSTQPVKLLNIIIFWKSPTDSIIVG